MKLGRQKGYSGALNWKGKRRLRRGGAETRGENMLGGLCRPWGIQTWRRKGVKITGPFPGI